jgi:predicted lysophospholipase L1 biosynthesis ABC-type transport system permease subunit
MILDALKVVFSVISAFILLLITTLYTTVDMASETADIALLKCSGFTEKDIRKWHMLRMTMILFFAMLLAYVAEYTAGNRIVAKIYELFDATGIRLYSDPVECLVVIPAIIFGIGLGAMRICMLRVKSINIQNIRED